MDEELLMQNFCLISGIAADEAAQWKPLVLSCWEELKGKLRQSVEVEKHQQRLALACSLMHEPDILFLDEPTAGVDPRTRREFWLHINSMVEKGVTVMVTTHFMDEAEYCDRIGLVYRGKLIASGTPDDLKAQSANDEQPDPTMEQAFIQLIHDWDKEHSNE